jgi:hypothetical protein
LFDIFLFDILSLNFLLFAVWHFVVGHF